MSTDSKEKIIQAALALFAEKGYSNTSVRDIARESGMNLSMISYHFGGKEKLQEAVFHHFMEEVKEELVSSSLPETLEERITHMIHSLTRTIQRNPHYWQMVIRELLNGHQKSIQLFRQELFPTIAMVFGQDFESVKSEARSGLPFYVLGPAVSAMVFSHFIYKPVITQLLPGDLPEDFYEKYPGILSNLIIKGLKNFDQEDQ